MAEDRERVSCVHGQGHRKYREPHLELEKQTVELAKSSLRAIEGKKGMIVQGYLLEYLLKDEEKHDVILEKLNEVKKGMYPYG